MYKPTLRALADRLGVVHQSIANAVRDGRLTDGITMDRGRVMVVDMDAAAAQWEATGAIKAAERSDANALYLAARARRESALADIAEIERDEKIGALVDRDEARADVIDRFTLVKTRILGVPSRLAQRFPHLAAEIVPVVDEILREVLTELAIEDGDGE